MAILIDWNQVAISGLLANTKTNHYLEEDLIRHIVLNTLRANTKKFKEYGEVILCCDSRNYWRKSIFPYYKAHRKSAREKSPLDWNAIFKSLNKLKQDLKEHFPYRVIEVDGAEADDVIATLTPRLSSSEKVLILSSDADFKQLQRYPNTKQYNPMLNVYVTSKNPLQELKEKVIRGDSGDGIPSILSPDDTFVTKTRQPPLTQKKLSLWLSGSIKDQLNEEQYRNYIRNSTLINFEHIPSNITQNIINEYEATSPNPKSKLYKYLVQNKLISLLESIEDF